MRISYWSSDVCSSDLYFVSYYDYYQPEAYVARSDTYIEKESSVNEAIDRMRHSATRALLERDDVIIVASVSCLYGIGSVETYSAMTFAMQKGETADQREIIRKLVALQYKRNDAAFARGNFRVRGDNLEIFPSHYERSEEHTSELQSLMRISYAVFCLKQKHATHNHPTHTHHPQ